MGLLEAIGDRADRLLGTVLLGVFLGKFIGDYAALKLTAAFGTEVGYLLGIGFSVVAYLVYPPLERRLQSGDTEG